MTGLFWQWPWNERISCSWRQCIHNFISYATLWIHNWSSKRWFSTSTLWLNRFTFWWWRPNRLCEANDDVTIDCATNDLTSNCEKWYRWIYIAFTVIFRTGRVRVFVIWAQLTLWPVFKFCLKRKWLYVYQCSLTPSTGNDNITTCYTKACSVNWWVHQSLHLLGCKTTYHFKIWRKWCS